MLYTEEAVKANIRNRDGRRVFYLGKGDTLTPGAADFLRAQRIEVLDASRAKVEEYRLLGGGYIRSKPEHMTHLSADLLVVKTHPRIVFRGQMDTLQAELVLCQLNLPRLAQPLEEILDLCRNLIRCDVLGEQVNVKTLCGLTADEIRSHSHFPQEYYSQPHFMPSRFDTEGVLLLNRCRCMARSAELAAVGAFVSAEGEVTRPDILQALNRVSSMLYILMIRLKKDAQAT